MLRLTERPELTLNSILLLVLGCQMIGATLLGTALEPTLGAAGVAVGIVIEIFVVFTLFEVVPKTFALQHTERSVLMISPLLSFLTGFWPLRVLTRGFIGIANVVLPGKGLRRGPFITEEEILTMADVAARESSIESEERELIHSIFEFGDTVVREVMVPRPTWWSSTPMQPSTKPSSARSRLASRGCPCPTATPTTSSAWCS